jgi:hypothetical protein
MVAVVLGRVVYLMWRHDFSTIDDFVRQAYHRSFDRYRCLFSALDLARTK